MAVHFGQLIAHDTDFVTPIADYGHAGNKGITVPKGDEWMDPNATGREMLHFRKSGKRSAGHSGPGPRLTDQVNKVSSWLDLSVVYGSDSGRSAILRSGRGGRLRAGGLVPSAFGQEAEKDGGRVTGIGSDNSTVTGMHSQEADSGRQRSGAMPRDHLPFNSEAAPNLNAVSRRRESLVLSGDNRANVQPGLLALHTLFSRLHNANTLLLARWAATGGLPDITDATAAAEVRWVRKALDRCSQAGVSARMCTANCVPGDRLGAVALFGDRRVCHLPSWAVSALPDEASFEAARALTRAQYQAVVLYEYLPAIIGRAMHSRLVGPYRGYSPRTDGRVLSSFATVAFRFGHSQVGRSLPRLASTWCPLAAEPLLSLRDAYFAPWRLLVAPTREGLVRSDPLRHEEDGVDTVLRGMMVQHAQAVDTLIADDVRNLLFGSRVRFDLISLNIQRGRDHKAGSYQSLRRVAGRVPAESMREITGGGPQAEVLAEALEGVYDGRVDAVDAIVGGLAEPKVAQDASLGLTMARLVAKQMLRLRQGDRFWFERPGVLSFNSSFLDTVRSTRLADILRVASSAFDGPAGGAAWERVTRESTSASRTAHDGAMRTPAKDFAWTTAAQALGSAPAMPSSVEAPGASLRPSLTNWSLGERFAVASDALSLAAIQASGLCTSTD